MRYDVHAHAFHPKIAAKVCAQLEEHYGNRPRGAGLIGELLEREKKAGIDRVVVLNAATAPAQVVPANNYMIELAQKHPEAIPFGTLHPHDANWEGELERLKKAGIKGLKFHADFQGFRMDDPALLPLLEAAHPDFVLLFHVGDTLPPRENPSCPYQLAALLDAFPAARVIAAHMGGYLHWQAAEEVLYGRDLYFDTSAALPFLGAEEMKRLLRRHPRERLLFGTDYPLWLPDVEVERQQRELGLGSDEMEELLSNAGALFDGKE